MCITTSFRGKLLLPAPWLLPGRWPASHPRRGGNPGRVWRAVSAASARLSCAGRTGGHGPTHDGQAVGNPLIGEETSRSPHLKRTADDLRVAQSYPLVEAHPLLHRCRLACRGRLGPGKFRVPRGWVARTRRIPWRAGAHPACTPESVPVRHADCRQTS